MLDDFSVKPCTSAFQIIGDWKTSICIMVTEWVGMKFVNIISAFWYRNAYSNHCATFLTSSWHRYGEKFDKLIKQGIKYSSNVAIKAKIVQFRVCGTFSIKKPMLKKHPLYGLVSSPRSLMPNNTYNLQTFISLYEFIFVWFWLFASFFVFQFKPHR